MKSNLPTISVILPTYNAAGILGICLEKISQQDYPKEKVEIVVGDGGSDDNTVAIAKKFGAKVYPNPQKTGEHGKAVAIGKATGEILALIDSDNILPDRNYFKRLVEPFQHPKVIVTQPLRFGWRREDGSINRYTALLGMTDPLILFQGTYDHYCYITNTWTKVRREEKKMDGYLVARFTGKEIPTIGANGCLIRKSVVDKYFRGDYYVDIDVVRDALMDNPDRAVAIVDTEIIHLFCDDIYSFIRKQRRRIKDYLFSIKSGSRESVLEQKKPSGQILFFLATVTIFPLVVQIFIGMLRKFDYSWFWHPVLCWVTLWVYGIAILRGRNTQGMESRINWQQTKITRNK